MEKARIGAEASPAAAATSFRVRRRDKDKGILRLTEKMGPLKNGLIPKVGNFLISIFLILIMQIISDIHGILKNAYHFYYAFKSYAAYSKKIRRKS
tara:strand:- start:9406 stop:9693 length:288 start_codon:yes stop_codon:yes gene_type:complete